MSFCLPLGPLTFLFYYTPNPQNRYKLPSFFIISRPLWFVLSIPLILITCAHSHSLTYTFSFDFIYFTSFGDRNQALANSSRRPTPLWFERDSNLQSPVWQSSILPLCYGRRRYPFRSFSLSLLYKLYLFHPPPLSLSLSLLTICSPVSFGLCWLFWHVFHFVLGYVDYIPVVSVQFTLILSKMFHEYWLALE